MMRAHPDGTTKPKPTQAESPFVPFVGFVVGPAEGGR